MSTWRFWVPECPECGRGGRAERTVDGRAVAVAHGVNDEGRESACYVRPSRLPYYQRISA